MWRTMPSKSMFWSCSPSGALVAGVKIGSARRSLSLQALGQPDAADVAGRLVLLPARAGQEATHDGLDRDDLGRLADHDPPAPRREVLDVERPRRGRRRARRWPPPRRPGRWPRRRRAGGWGRVDSVSANQNRDSPVRTRPLSGISVGSTTSKALIRSEAMSSSRPSGSSNRSRTLPERRNASAVSTGDLRGRRRRDRRRVRSSRAMTSWTWRRKAASSKHASRSSSDSFWATAGSTASRSRSGTRSSAARRAARWTMA